MIELILMYLLGSIDIFMLGKYSDEAVAIVGVSNQIIWMVNLMFVVITSGTTILLTQYFGSNKDEKNIVEICGLSIGVNGVLGIVLSIVIILGGEFMFKLLNTPSELISMGNTYMGIVGGASFVAAIMMTFTATFTATPAPAPAPTEPTTPPARPTRPTTRTTAPTGNATVENAVTPSEEKVEEKAAEIKEVLKSDDDKVPVANQKLDDLYSGDAKKDNPVI